MNPAKSKVDVVEQLGQLVESGGYVRIGDFVFTRLTGGDRQNWLNNFCTADIKSLRAGQGSEAFVLNVKGKTIAHMFVLVSEEDIALLAIGTLDQSLVDHFDRYIIREDVQVADESGSKAVCFVCGPNAAPLFQGIVQPAPPISHAIDGAKNIVTATAFCSANDWLVVSEKANADAMETDFQTRGFVRCDDSAFELARIKNMMPINGREVSSEQLPQEFRRDKQAISFTKGCYLGQETVARIDALGHVNQFLVKLELNVDKGIAPGVQLMADGKIVGRVTSAVALPTENKTLALGFVRRALAKPGSQMDCEQAMATVIE